MARRASKRLDPRIFIGVAVVLVGVLVYLTMIRNDSSRTSGNFEKISQKIVDKIVAKNDGSALNMTALEENGNSLRGNKYIVHGQIDEKLLWTADRGQLVSFRVKTPEGDKYLGIEIPPEFKKFNFETKQDHLFWVKFRQGGIAVVTSFYDSRKDAFVSATP